MGRINWLYKGKEITSTAQYPNWANHFVYLITDENGRKYVGKKQITSVRNVKTTKSNYNRLKKLGYPVKRTKDKKRSTKKNIVWNYKKTVKGDNGSLNYTGSCVPLNKKIKNGLSYKKEILYFCKTKKQATYYELKEQFCRGVIENDLYWNENILNKFFKRDLA